MKNNLTITKAKFYHDTIDAYRLYLDGIPVEVLAKKYNLTKSTIYRRINQGMEYAEKQIIIPSPKIKTQIFNQENVPEYEDRSGIMAEMIKDNMKDDN